MFGTNLGLILIDNCGKLPTWLTSISVLYRIAQKYLPQAGLLRGIKRESAFPEAAKQAFSSTKEAITKVALNSRPGNATPISLTTDA